MEHQKTSSRIHHVPEEEPKSKLKTKGCAEGRDHRKFNHKIESSSHLAQSCAHKGYCMMNTMNYNYKLRSVIGGKDDSTANMWTRFDKQVRVTFLW